MNSFMTTISQRKCCQIVSSFACNAKAQVDERFEKNDGVEKSINLCWNRRKIFHLDGNVFSKQSLFFSLFCLFSTSPFPFWVAIYVNGYRVSSSYFILYQCVVLCNVGNLSHSFSQEKRNKWEKWAVRCLKMLVFIYLNAENHLLLTMLWMQSITLFFYYCTKVSMQLKERKTCGKENDGEVNKTYAGKLMQREYKNRNDVALFYLSFFLPLFVFSFEHWGFQNENNNKSWQPNRKNRNLCKHTSLS